MGYDAGGKSRIGFFYVKRQCYAYVNFLYYFGLIICILLHFFSELELNMCLK